MDALKKAEEAKRQSEAAAQAELPQSTPAAADNNTRGLPELPSRLELLDHEFHTPAPKAEPTIAPAAAQKAAAAALDAAAPSPEKPARPSAETLQRERNAAQNVFVAKQQPQGRHFLIAGGVAASLACAGIGGYVWWQMQPKGGLGPMPATARTPSPPPAPVAAAPAQPAALPVPAARIQAPAPPEDEDKPAAAATPLPTLSRPQAAKPAPVQAAAAEPESPIRITTARLKLNPQIASAYQAFQAGDLATALRDYQLVLKSEPKNVDALHGLAAISLQQGRPEAAEALYLRILEADPKDAAAQAGLIGLRGQIDPMQSESRLKNLLASQPDSATLNFALGNLYAQQGRWNDAQQAYFRAYTGDSENPDYQFNLAVSLDQLRQPKLALQYYQGALAAATQRPAAFDRNQVAGRISELQK